MKTKIDCSIAENYITERNKIRNENCGISNKIFDAETDRNPKLAIEIVQNWSDEHPVEPVVTYLDYLLEVFPNTKIICDGTPEMCPRELGLKDIEECHLESDCIKCWKQPYKEGKNG